MASEAAYAEGSSVSFIRGSEGLVDEDQVAEWHKRLPESEVVTVAGPHNLHEASPTALAKSLSCLDYS